VMGLSTLIEYLKRRGLSEGEVLTCLVLKELIDTSFNAADIKAALHVGEQSIYRRMTKLKRLGVIHFTKSNVGQMGPVYNLYWVIDKPGQKCPEGIRTKATNDQVVAFVKHPKHGIHQVSDGHVKEFTQRWKIDYDCFRAVIAGRITNHDNWQLAKRNS